MKIFILTLLFFLIGCRKESNGWEMYRIYQGQHKCNGWRCEIVGPKMEQWWKFDPDCFYEPDIENDINKLTGLGALDNQNNSIRIDWRCVNNKFQLLGYVHNNDTEITIMDSVNPNESFYIRVEYINGGAEIQVKNKILIVNDIKKPTTIFRQNPYFGGQSTAPHDMTLYMR